MSKYICSLYRVLELLDVYFELLYLKWKLSVVTKLKTLGITVLFK